MAELKFRISLEDYMSEQVTKSINSMNRLKESATSASQAINSIRNRKFSLNASVSINAFDKTKAVRNEIKNQLSSLAKNSNIAIKAKDKTESTISKIKSRLVDLKDVASKVLSTIELVGKATIMPASQLEQQELAMKHSIAYNNQKTNLSDVQKTTDDYVSQLRTGIGAKLFDQNEVMEAGHEAVNVTAGDTKQAMNLVKLSENMAAFNPGKSVVDAMKALSDLKSGETKGMSDFGINISENDIDKAGGAEKYFKTQTGDKGSISKAFNGGVDEMNKTTAGKLSTVKNNLQSIGTNFGKAFLPVINNVLTPLSSLLDKNSDKFAKLGNKIVEVGEKIKKFLTPVFNNVSKEIKKYLVPVLKNIPSIVNKYIMPTFKFLQSIAQKYIIPAITSILDVVKKYVPPIAKAFGDFINRIKPHLEKFWNIIEKDVIPIIQDLWKKVQDIMPGVRDLIEVAFKVGAKAVGIAVDIFGDIAPVIKNMYDTISPILNWIISLFDKVAGAIKEAVDWLENWNGKSTNIQNDKATNLSKLGMPGMTSAGNMPGYKQPSSKSSKNDLSKLGVPGMTSAGNLPGFNALGTTYWKGGETWVGENGPEKLMLPGGSKILSNRQSMDSIMPNMNQSNGSNSMGLQANKWGQDIPDSMAKGIKNNTKSVTDATTFMATKIKELIHFTAPDKGPLSDFDTYPVDMMKTFGDGIKDNTKLVTNPTTNMSTHVKGVYSNLNTDSLSYGAQTMQEFGSGIQASAGNVIAIVKSLTDKVIEQFKTGFGIHSPSVVMFKMGSYLMQGLVNGMTSKDVKTFINKWIGDITGSAGGNVAGWISAALAITGSPMSWLPKLLDIASRESGDPGKLGTGNPLLVNDGPGSATGLMQCMPSTFAEYALPGLGDILNPIDNAVAAIRYIKSTYGSPENIYTGPGYKGYAVGLTRVPYDNFPAMLHEDERVLTANEARNYNKKTDKASVIIQKLADKIEVRDDSDIDKIATALAKKLKSVAFNM